MKSNIKPSGRLGTTSGSHCSLFWTKTKHETRTINWDLLYLLLLYWVINNDKLMWEKQPRNIIFSPKKCFLTKNNTVCIVFTVITLKLVLRKASLLCTITNKWQTLDLMYYFQLIENTISASQHYMTHFHSEIYKRNDTKVLELKARWPEC